MVPLLSGKSTQEKEIQHFYRAVGEGVAGGAIAPPVFCDFHLFSQKSAPKMLKIGLFCVFRPPSFLIAPSLFKKLQRPCLSRFKT